MKTSAKGRAFIEQIEESGVAKLKPYNDGTGTLTIGFGHTSTAGPPKVYRGMTITAEQADAILASDLRSVEIEVEHLVHVPLTQAQFDTLVSFQFNLGKLGRSTLLKRLNAGNYNAVPAELLKWNKMKIGGVLKTAKGLVKRRRAEGAMWTGDYASAMKIAKS